MSLEVRVNSGFKNATDYIRDTVTSNLVQAKRLKKINVSDKELEAINNIIVMSFEQGLNASFRQIDSVVKEIKSEYGS